MSIKVPRFHPDKVAKYLSKYVCTRGTSILGEMRNVEISGATLRSLINGNIHLLFSRKNKIVGNPILKLAMVKNSSKFVEKMKICQKNSLKRKQTKTYKKNQEN